MELVQRADEMPALDRAEPADFPFTVTCVPASAPANDSSIVVGQAVAVIPRGL